MLKHQIGVVSLTCDVPNRGAKLAGLFEPSGVFRGVHLRHLSPAIEFTPVDDTFCAEPYDKLTFAFITDHANGIGAHHIGQLHGIRAQTARCPPNQYILPRFQLMGRMAKEHSVGRGQGQRVAGAFFPGLMLWTRHQLLALNPGKLAE